MRVISTKATFIGFILGVGTSIFGISVASAQSVADNIRPVSQVCIAGQPCVGQTVGSAEVVAEPPVQSAPEPATPATIEETAQPEPAAEVAVADSDFDVEARYQMSCFACHATGAAGAPLLGDAEAWNTRLEKGMDAVMANVLNGVNAMPAKGLCMDCSDDNLRALVDYMISQ